MSEPERTSPPDLLVEQLALGELDDARATALRAELERETAGEAGRDRLAEIQASNREILADYPPERVAAEIRRRIERGSKRASPSGRSRWIAWVLAPVLVAAAVLVGVVIDQSDDPVVATFDPKPTGEGEGDEIRIKGGVEPHLVIDRRTQTGHERLGAGEGVRAGDLLQVSYVPAGRREGVIVSIDGAGVVTLHHPSAADDDPRLLDGNEVPLANSYELDDAPGFERFLFVTRDAGPTISVAEVMAAAEQLASNPAQARIAPLGLAGEGWSQHSILLHKISSGAEADALEPISAATEGGS